MKLWTILVPTVRPDGKYFRLRYHKVWDKKVREITGGLTILQPSKGIWLNDGQVYEERMIPVLIACSEEQIKQVVTLTGKYYSQKAIFWWKVTDEVHATNFDATVGSNNA